MKKSIFLLASLALVITLGFTLSSCKDGEKPSKANISFTSASKTVQESVGTLEVKVVLDKPVSTDVIVSYDVDGTATEKAGLNQGDYELLGDPGEITILKGQTIGTFEINIINDEVFESDETIHITLSDVSGNEATISSDDETEITIQNDDVAPKASFAASTMTVSEDDGIAGLLDIEVSLDKATPQDVNVQYELSGTALDSVYAYTQGAPNEYYDYYIDGESGVIPIASGETTGKISIQLLSDFHFEDDETIIITLKASTGIQVGTTNKLTITMKQENGKIIALLWDDPSYTDVDMDMFLWIGSDVNSLNGVIATSLTPSTSTKQEYVFMPTAFVDLFSDGAFGLSYVYYSGTANPLNFEVQFADYTDGVIEALADRDVYNGSYALVNINPWDNNTSGTDPQIEQTFTIAGGAYSNISSITIPTSGSRAKTYPIPSKFVRSKAIKQTRIF